MWKILFGCIYFDRALAQYKLLPGIVRIVKVGIKVALAVYASYNVRM